jgi:uncharacterized protein YdhG (YjbR/CyaY superfamily)
VARTLKTPPKEVVEYLAGLSPGYRAVLDQLRKAIKIAAPNATEAISYRIPSFQMKVRLVYSAAFKDHCSFFVASHRVRQRFSKELTPFESGRGTLRFTRNIPFPRT